MRLPERIYAHIVPPSRTVVELLGDGASLNEKFRSRRSTSLNGIPESAAESPLCFALDPLHRRNQILNGRCGFLEGRVFGVRQIERQDLLHSIRPKLDRHTDVDIFDAVLTFKIDAAGENAVLV